MLFSDIVRMMSHQNMSQVFGAHYKVSTINVEYCRAIVTQDSFETFIVHPHIQLTDMIGVPALDRHIVDGFDMAGRFDADNIGGGLMR